MSFSRFNDEEIEILCELNFNVQNMETDSDSALCRVACWGYLQVDSVSVLEKYMKRLIDMHDWSKYVIEAIAIVTFLLDNSFPSRELHHTEKTFRRVVETCIPVEMIGQITIATASKRYKTKYTVVTMLEYVDDINSLRRSLKQHLNSSEQRNGVVELTLVYDMILEAF